MNFLVLRLAKLIKQDTTNDSQRKEDGFVSDTHTSGTTLDWLPNFTLIWIRFRGNVNSIPLCNRCLANVHIRRLSSVKFYFWILFTFLDLKNLYN